jgi:hypothetical protein
LEERLLVLNQVDVSLIQGDDIVPEEVKRKTQNLVGADPPSLIASWTGVVGTSKKRCVGGCFDKLKTSRVYRNISSGSKKNKPASW